MLSDKKYLIFFRNMQKFYNFL